MGNNTSKRCSHCNEELKTTREERSLLCFQCSRKVLTEKEKTKQEQEKTKQEQEKTKQEQEKTRRLEKKTNYNAELTANHYQTVQLIATNAAKINNGQERKEYLHETLRVLSPVQLSIQEK